MFGRAWLAGLLLLASAGAAAAADTQRIALDAARRSALAELPGLLGEMPTAAELEGQVVVLGFFASWCPPCGPEFDTLNAVRDEFAGRGVQVLAVNIFEHHFQQDADARLAAFLARKTPRFPVLGEGARVAGLFGPVTRIPTTFVFGRDGEPAMHFIHLKGATKTHASLDELRAAVAAAVR